MAEDDDVSRADVSSTIEDVGTRVGDLETREVEQAGLLTQMAAQEEALSRGLQTLSARVTALLWVSSAALVLAVVAIVVAVVR